MVTIVAADSDQNAASSGFKPADIWRPAAFPHPVTRLELRETAISWVILTGPFAYKVKKGVKYGFIDTSTLAQRRYLCEEELRLNRRLAANLYVDVVAITEDTGGGRIGGEGRVIEYAVRMQQFEASQELLTLLEHAEVGQQELVQRETPRLCRGGSRSLTNPGVHP